MDLKKWKLFQELDPSLVSACKFARIVDFPKVGFLVLENDDVYAVTDVAANFICLGNGNNSGAVVNQASKVESLCGKGIIDFYGNQVNFAALTEDGSVYSWSSTKTTQLTPLCRQHNHGHHPGVDGMPRKIIFPDAHSIKVHQVSHGHIHALCLSSDGEVFGWNTNAYRQLGSESAGVFVCNAIKVAGLDDSIVQVAAGNFTSYALDFLGKVWSWGSSKGSSLGYRADDNQCTPRLIQNLPKIIKIAAGPDHVLALSEIGQVYFWGKFQFFTPVLLPIEVRMEGMGPVIDIAPTRSAGFAAVQNKNRVYLWGRWYGNNLLMPKATSTRLASVEDVFACAMSPIMLKPIRRKIQPQGVVAAWTRAFNDPSTADVVFSVGSEVLHAHSVFLKLRSDYFRSMFDGVWKESRRESGAIEIHGFSFRIFRAFMYFLYSDSFIEDEMSVDDLLELMKAADYYGDGELRLACENKLKTKLTPENACLIYTCAVRSNAEDLQKYAVEFIVQTSRQICCLR